VELVDVEIGVLREVDFEIETVFHVGLEGVVEVGDGSRVAGVFYKLAEAGEGFGFCGAGRSDLFFENCYEAFAPVGEQDGQVGLPVSFCSADSGEEIGAFWERLKDVFEIGAYGVALEIVERGGAGEEAWIKTLDYGAEVVCDGDGVDDDFAFAGRADASQKQRLGEEWGGGG